MRPLLTMHLCICVCVYIYLYVYMTNVRAAHLGTRTEEAPEARRGAQALDAGQAHRSFREYFPMSWVILVVYVAC